MVRRDPGWRRSDKTRPHGHQWILGFDFAEVDAAPSTHRLLHQCIRTAPSRRAFPVPSRGPKGRRYSSATRLFPAVSLRSPTPIRRTGISPTHLASIGGKAPARDDRQAIRQQGTKPGIQPLLDRCCCVYGLADATYLREAGHFLRRRVLRQRSCSFELPGAGPRCACSKTRRVKRRSQRSPPCFHASSGCRTPGYVRPRKLCCNAARQVSHTRGTAATPAWREKSVTVATARTGVERDPEEGEPSPALRRGP